MERQKYVRLCDCVTVFRGYQLPADKLKRTDKNTEFKYLVLSDIQNGVILDESKLQNLETVPQGQEKFCLRNGDILISKTTVPYKFAVAQDISGTILVAGDMFILRQLESSPPNPYYLKAYLEQDKIVQTLKKFDSNSQIPSVRKETLEYLRIPLIPEEEQKGFEKLYRAALGRIKEAQKELKESVKDAAELIESLHLSTDRFTYNIKQRQRQSGLEY